MIPLAIIEGKLVFFLVAAVVGVINWLSEKRKKAAEAAAQPPPKSVRNPAQRSAASETEQERLRRFLETLGVPQPPAQPPRQPPSQSRVPSQPNLAVQAALRSRIQSQTARKKIVPRPGPVVRRAPAEIPRANRLEEPATPIENIPGEFGAMNVRVTMTPVPSLGSSAHMAIGNAGTTTVLERDGSPIAATLRRLLHNPTDLRAAFVAMEVVGTPRGLQS